jgi:membrane-associated phospholipid phosphatase
MIIKNSYLRIILPVVFISILVNVTVAQTDSTKMIDSISVNLHPKWYASHYVQESIAPVSLAIGSVAIMAIPGLKQDLQKTLSWNFNPETKGIYTTLWEDQIRYAPTLAAYAISLCGVKSKHRFIDKTAILAVSYIASDFVVYNCKTLTKSLRPPGRDYVAVKDMYSLPSQHTAMAFIAATFLDHELGYISPWISVAGYTAASWVGVARVANNFHWTSDVLMGAAVGIVMTNASYWAYDGVMKLFPKNLTIAPSIDPQQTGLYVCYKF